MARPYPWPASALRPQEMKLLYEAREKSARPASITRPLARAVQETFGRKGNPVAKGEDECGS